MIPVPSHIICPWCDKEIDPAANMPSIFRCHCGNLAETDNELRNLTYTMSAAYTHKDFGVGGANEYHVEEFGIFLTLDYNNYISCDYNMHERNPFIISLCSYTTPYDTLLCSNAKITGKDMNEIANNAVVLLRRYQKLLAFL